ncbi:DMT family transporter [Marinobacteraceae bacterium S3BR75-40.1]
MSDQPVRTRRQGFLLTGLGVLFLSPDGLLVKITATDGLVFLFWRGVLLALALLAIGLGRYRRRWPAELRRCGRRGWICAIGFAGSTLGFVMGMKHTAAGNVLVILNTAPVIAAVMAWAIWNERLPRRTWGVILVCVGGAGLMAWSEMGRGNPLGLVMAAVAALSLATNLNAARSRPEADMSLMLFIGAALVAIGAALMGGARFPGWQDMRYILLLCLVFMPVASTLIQIGPRFLPAAEVSLMLLLETVIGSFLVWLFLGEVPPTLSIWGGGVILVTLVANGLWEAHLERQRRYWMSAPP